MNQNRGTAEPVPATTATAGTASGAGDGAALRLPEDPFPPRAGRRRGLSGSRAGLHGTPALILLASLIVSLLAASSAPTPLYDIYQQQWGFSPITTTVVFGVYALAVLASLLTLGRLSDYAGRRPVLLAALAVQVISMAVFATADGVGDLLIARVIQGLATGAALGAIGAGLLDIDRERGTLANAMSPGLGTGSGALLSALFVRYLPAPTHLIYLALIGVIAVQAVGVALLRETVTASRVPAAALVPEVRLPRSVRGPVLAAAPVLFAVWALAGLYAALGPAIVRTLTGSANVVLGGGSLTLLTVTAVISVYLLRNTPARTVMRRRHRRPGRRCRDHAGGARHRVGRPVLRGHGGQRGRVRRRVPGRHQDGRPGRRAARAGRGPVAAVHGLLPRSRGAGRGRGVPRGARGGPDRRRQGLLRGADRARRPRPRRPVQGKARERPVKHGPVRINWPHGPRAEFRLRAQPARPARF